ncbi:MAG: cytochrome c [Opitutaceae bacterium]|nr:cytochrome c [Opitutaceae bacterium]
MTRSLLLFALVAALGCASVSHAADATTNWKAQCAKCHASDGSGKTSMGARLAIKDYTVAASLADMTDAQLTEAIASGVKVEGKSVMPAYAAKLTAEEIAELVAHIRAMAKS